MDHIRFCVKRLSRQTAFGMTIGSIGFFFHQMCRILEHDLAEVSGSRSRVNGPFEILFDQQRHPTAMIDMSMSEQQDVERPLIVTESVLVELSFSTLEQSG